MKKQDFLLIGILLLIACALYLGYRLYFHTPGGYVQITVDGKSYKTLALNQNTTITITTPDGGTNLLTIRDGYADMTEADCPDKLCVSQTRISHKGETIVCLPHKIVVKILDGKPKGTTDPDAVAY